MRASDDDRERVTERLRQAAAEGRLLGHELEERIARALRARTYGELDETVSDLPGTPAKRSRSRQLARSHPVAAVAIVGATALVVAMVVAVMVAWLLMAWGMWLMIALIVMATRRGGHHERHHHHGGGGRPDGGFGPRTHPGGDRW